MVWIETYPNSSCQVSDTGVVLGSKGGVLKGWLVGRGYRVVDLGRQVGRFYVHDLVCTAFHGPRPDGHEVNHKDTNKTNNRADNLEWVTPVQNHAHRVSYGTQNTRILDDNRVRQIRARSTENPLELSKEFGVSRDTIYSVIRRKTWKHV